MDKPNLSTKLEEIRQELRALGLWQTHFPQWLSRYEAMPGRTGIAFLPWLQFIYLPNKGCHDRLSSGVPIAPQAAAFLKEVQDKGRLLQLLVELDALI